jgi:hypothetical protein
LTNRSVRTTIPGGVGGEAELMSGSPIPIKGQGEGEVEGGGMTFCFTQPAERTRWFTAVNDEETGHQHKANRQRRHLP